MNTLIEYKVLYPDATSKPHLWRIERNDNGKRYEIDLGKVEEVVPTLLTQFEHRLEALDESIRRLDGFVWDMRLQGSG